jgi:hypothetical protein
MSGFSNREALGGCFTQPTILKASVIVNVDFPLLEQLGQDFEGNTGYPT